MKEQDDFDIQDEEDAVAVEQASPISISPAKPPVNLFSDFQIAPDRKDEVEAARRTKAKREALRRSQAPDPSKILISAHEDFVTNEQAQVRESEIKKKIRARAKEIYNSYSDKLKTFEKARKVYIAATEEELANPGPELAVAMKVVDLGQPMSKKIALKMAQDEFRNAGASYL